MLFWIREDSFYDDDDPIFKVTRHPRHMVATPDMYQDSRRADPWVGHAWYTLLNSSVYPCPDFVAFKVGIRCIL